MWNLVESRASDPICDEDLLSHNNDNNARFKTFEGLVAQVTTIMFPGQYLLRLAAQQADEELLEIDKREWNEQSLGQ